MRALLAMIGGMTFLALLLGGTGGGQPSPIPMNPVRASSGGEGTAVSGWGTTPATSNEPRESKSEGGDAPPSTAPAPDAGSATNSAPRAVGTWGDGHPYPAEKPADALPPIDSGGGAQAATGTPVTQSSTTQTPATGGWGAPMMDPKPSR